MYLLFNLELLTSQGTSYSLFRQSTNWTNTGPKWYEECEFCWFWITWSDYFVNCAKLASFDWSDSGRVCSFWITWSTFQNFVETWPSKLSADEFFLIVLHWPISNSKKPRHNSHDKQVAQAALFVTKLNNQYFSNISNNE